MKLVSRPIWAFLADPFRKRPRALSLEGDVILASGGSHARIELSELAKAPALQRGRFTSSLALDLGNGRVQLPAVPRVAAQHFGDAVEKAWSHYNLEQLEKEEEPISSLLMAIDRLRRRVAGFYSAVDSLSAQKMWKRKMLSSGGGPS